MHRAPLAILLLCLAMGAHGMAAGARGADFQGWPRNDENSRIGHRQLVEKAGRGVIDVYFLGDSITRRWGCTDPQYRGFMENWRSNFFGWNAANFGWGGDTTHNALWRVQNGELDGVHPKVIVVQIGTNDIGSRRYTPDEAEAKVAEVTEGVRAILAVCREKAPDATVCLTGVFPRDDNPDAGPIIRRVNERLQGLATEEKARFVNINDRLADESGRLRPGMAGDGLHLTEQGYQVWADALKPILTELLGPPQEVDRAPPPTGDPSAPQA